MVGRGLSIGDPKKKWRQPEVDPQTTAAVEPVPAEDPYGYVQPPTDTSGFGGFMNQLKYINRTSPGAFTQLGAGIMANDVAGGISHAGQEMQEGQVLQQRAQEKLFGYRERQRTESLTRQWLKGQFPEASEADLDAMSSNPDILNSLLKRAEGGTAQNEFAPVLMKDKNGNYFYASPDPNTGQLNPYDMPEGAEPVDPYTKAYETQRGKEEGEFNTKQALQAPGIISGGERTLLDIDYLKKDPDKTKALATGATSLANIAPGSPGFDFANRVKRVKASAMTQAIQALHGLGVMSDADRDAAMAATNRIELATSVKEFDAAVEDYEYFVQHSMEVARKRAAAGGITLNAPYRGPNAAPEAPTSGNDSVKKKYGF